MWFVSAKRNTLEWSDENLCWFDRVLGHSKLPSSSEHCAFIQERSALFILSLQWKFNCCYFSRNNTGLVVNILERIAWWEKVIEIHTAWVPGVISRQCLLLVNDVLFCSCQEVFQWKVDFFSKIQVNTFILT